MLIVMNKSTHEEHLSQPLQTNIKQFQIAATFLAGSDGIFNVTNKNNNFYLTKSINDDFNQITIPPVAYEIKSLNDENKRFIIKEGYFSTETYPFTTKPNFSTLGSVMEISPGRGIQFSSVQDDSLRSLLGFNPETIYEKYNQSPHPVDIRSFDNVFI